MKTKQIKIVVTKEIIKKSIKALKSDPFNLFNKCPIALAGKGKCGRNFFYKDDTLYSLSKRADKFIQEFDYGKAVKPATFIFKAT